MRAAAAATVRRHRDGGIDGGFEINRRGTRYKLFRVTARKAARRRGGLRGCGRLRAAEAGAMAII